MFGAGVLVSSAQTSRDTTEAAAVTVINTTFTQNSVSAGAGGAISLLPLTAKPNTLPTNGDGTLPTHIYVQVTCS
jgi:hypothetical protein